ncbi:hypothetical protein P0136_12565 [Lentisphaerota bacterium ZTH]|nr:hypothetical protein JYG24_09920 [Lentisphaerota bacterium]WET06191.1 hypothetical protein P0136_12565 [Lentisphaerota bacterium ZTH]
MKSLKSQGTLLILNEAYEDAEFAERNKLVEEEAGGRIYSPGELEKIVMEAGFNSCEIRLDAARNWLCLIAEK